MVAIGVSLRGLIEWGLSLSFADLVSYHAAFFPKIKQYFKKRKEKELPEKFDLKMLQEPQTICHFIWSYAYVVHCARKGKGKNGMLCSFQTND